jgi:YidC/Oxa1 family membrane protein insertase
LNFWELIAVQPMINILIVVSHFLANSPGLAIIALTIIINIAIFPFTLKQIKSSVAIQQMQPKLVELQKKYGKDKNKMAQEQMRLYKEAGMSPTGCIIPMLVQMPIWIALNMAITRLIAIYPENYLDLGRFLYSWPILYPILPLPNNFLWFNLGLPDYYMVLPLLVGATMWVQQKMVTPANADPKQQSQNQMMLWMMPIMFAMFSLQYSSGLSLFWVVSSIMRIGIQYFVAGWGGLIPRRKPKEATIKSIG